MKKIYLSALAVASIISVSEALTLKDSVQSALNTNSEIISNKLSIDASKQDIEIEKSAYKPRVDFTTTVQKDKKTNDYNNGSEVDKNINGYISTLSAEQLLYDGGKTSARIDEKESTYKSTVSAMTQKNEATIFEIAKSYNRLVENNILSQINEYNIKSHNNALEIAYNKEQISGELLESKKTLSLLSSLKDSKISQESQSHENILTFTRLTGIETQKDTCRPILDETLIPENVEKAVELALKNNKEIQKQIATIEMQNQKINIEEANYLPTVKAKVLGTYDNDIELEEQGDQKSLKGELSLNWNFYSGGRDESAAEKEKINLKKEKSNLENTQNVVKEKVSSLYTKYSQLKERIEILQKNLKIDLDILQITRNQLSDGTKTFADELESKSKVFESQINIIKLETEIQDVYFELQYHLGNLTDSILNAPEQMCAPLKIDDLANGNINPSENLDALLNVMPQAIPSVKAPSILTEQPIQEIPLAQANSNSLVDALKNIYIEDYSFNPDTLTATFNISSNSFTVNAVNDQDIFKVILDSFSSQFLDIIQANQDNVSKIIVGSHTSSEFRKYTDSSKIYNANKGLSQRRANKVKNYFYEKSMEKFGNIKMVEDKFETIGFGSDQPIYKNGKEDQVASRRVTIQVMTK